MWKDELVKIQNTEYEQVDQVFWQLYLVFQKVNEPVLVIAAFIVLSPHNPQKIDSVRLEMFDTLIFQIHALEIIYMLNLLLLEFSDYLKLTANIFHKQR